MTFDANPAGLMIDGRMVPDGTDLRSTLHQLLTTGIRRRVEADWKRTSTAQTITWRSSPCHACSSPCLRTPNRRSNPILGEVGVGITFVDNNDLYIMRANGRGLRRIIDTPARDPADTTWKTVGGPSWLPGLR